MLQLNQRAGFFKDLKNNPQLQQQQQHVEDVLLPTAVRPFPSRVVSASLGTGHSGVLLENGHVHLFGQNVNGELGTGNNQPVCYGCTRPVKALLAKACVVVHILQLFDLKCTKLKHLICGDGFTMVGTLDNEIYFWGLRGGGGGSGDGAEEVSIETVLEEGSGKVYKMARTREGWQLSASVRTNVTILQPMLVLRFVPLPCQLYFALFPFWIGHLPCGQCRPQHWLCFSIKALDWLDRFGLFRQAGFLRC